MPPLPGSVLGPVPVQASLSSLCSGASMGFMGAWHSKRLAMGPFLPSMGRMAALWRSQLGAGSRALLLGSWMTLQGSA